MARTSCTPLSSCRQAPCKFTVAPLIFLDAGHMRRWAHAAGTYATTVVPGPDRAAIAVAHCLCVAEDSKSMTFMLRHHMLALRSDPAYATATYVAALSDEGLAIQGAIAAELPGTKSYLCSEHIPRGLPKGIGRKAKQLMEACAQAETEGCHDAQLARLVEVSGEAADVVKAKHASFCRAFADPDHPKYGIV